MPARRAPPNCYPSAPRMTSTRCGTHARGPATNLGARRPSGDNARALRANNVQCTAGEGDKPGAGRWGMWTGTPATLLRGEGTPSTPS